MQSEVKKLLKKLPKYANHITTNQLTKIIAAVVDEQLNQPREIKLKVSRKIPFSLPELPPELRIIPDGKPVEQL